MTEDQRKQMMYTGVMHCRNNEVALRYARATILVAINLGAFSFLGIQLSNPIPVLYPIISVFRVLSCFFWFLINRKAQTRINYWTSCLAKMEPAETELSALRVFTGKEWAAIHKWPTFEAFFNLVPITFGALWIGVFVLGPSLEKKEPSRSTVILFQFNNLKGGGE